MCAMNYSAQGSDSMAQASSETQARDEILGHTPAGNVSQITLVGRGIF